MRAPVRLPVKLPLLRPPKSTLAALAAVAVPVPLHLVGLHRQPSGGNTHRVDQSTVQAKSQQSGNQGPQTSGGQPPANVLALGHVRPQSSQPASPAGTRKPAAGAGLAFAVSGPGVTRAHKRHKRHKRPMAHAAGDPSDTISDFKFTPASITIHVGDTITWTNVGPTEHSATANNGSFNTGILQKGQSASHTFTTAGTFAYICSIHPFMHGTVVVEASGTSPSSSGSGTSNTTSGSTTSSSSSSTPTSTTSTTSSSSGSSLPMTGLNVPLAVVAALVLVGAGAALRRRVSSGQ